MSYRNDQFYKLYEMTGEYKGAAYSADGRRNYRHIADNPPFIYPDRDIRTWDSKGDKEIKLLQRGFMRNIPRLDNEPTFKCQFQFNPQTLTQDVNYTETVYNHFMRDPGSFAQPYAGNAQMAFTLLFDRSMEINNPLKGSFAGKPGDTRTFSGGSDIPDIRNPWETGGPEYVGVLRDIAAMYSVIGQGVNSEELSSQVEAAKTLLKSEALGQGSAISGEGSEEYEEALAALNSAFSQQVGNYAFLAPKPIRMVFSSLYIVEGYVTASSVTFSKFNSSYVPIQAQVHLSMSVQHIGFAKKNTYTTYAIEEAKKAQGELEEATRQYNRDAYAEVEKALTNWKVSMYVTIPGGAAQDVATGAYWDESLGVTTPTGQFMVIDGSTNDFSDLKELFEAGNTSMSFRGEFYLYTDLDIPPNPYDQNSLNPRPVVSYYFNPAEEFLGGNITSKASFERVFEKPAFGFHPGALAGSTQTPDLFTPVTENGGNWSYQFILKIEVTHNGSRLVGTDTVTKTFRNGTLSDWQTDITTKMQLGWTYTGDPVATAPIGPSITTQPAVNSPSRVGAPPPPSRKPSTGRPKFVQIV